MRFAGTLDEVAARAKAQRVRVKLLTPEDALRAHDVLVADPRVGSVVQEPREVHLLFQGAPQDVPALHRKLVLADVPVFGFEVDGTSLESLFLEVTRGTVT